MILIWLLAPDPDRAYHLDSDPGLTLVLDSDPGLAFVLDSVKAGSGSL